MLTFQEGLRDQARAKGARLRGKLSQPTGFTA